MSESAGSAPNDRWLARLRAQLVEVARRRVPADDVEDVVQATMQVIFEKRVSATTASVEGAPPIAWCLQTLRHKIGNYYRRARTVRRFVERRDDLEKIAEPFEAREAEDQARAIEAAVEELQAKDAQCGRYVQRLVRGETPAEIAASENLEPHSFYQRLYRCRRKIREILHARGVLG